MKSTVKNKVLTLVLLKSIDYSLRTSLSKRAGRPNFRGLYRQAQNPQNWFDARFGFCSKNWAR